MLNWFSLFTLFPDWANNDTVAQNNAWRQTDGKGHRFIIGIGNSDIDNTNGWANNDTVAQKNAWRQTDGKSHIFIIGIGNSDIDNINGRNKIIKIPYCPSCKFSKYTELLKNVQKIWPGNGQPSFIITVEWRPLKF